MAFESIRASAYQLKHRVLDKLGRLENPTPNQMELSEVRNQFPVGKTSEMRWIRRYTVPGSQLQTREFYQTQPYYEGNDGDVSDFSKLNFEVVKEEIAKLDQMENEMISMGFDHQKLDWSVEYFIQHDGEELPPIEGIEPYRRYFHKKRLAYFFEQAHGYGKPKYPHSQGLLKEYRVY